jgi:DNA-binding MarR family transcriptional regulator
MNGAESGRAFTRVSSPRQGRLAVTAREIDLICRAIIDGRRAARTLAVWAAPFELSEPEFLVLWCLQQAATAGADQTTIAQLLALSPAQVSATVERLRSDGHIVREMVSGDRRRHLWRLSATGRDRICALLGNLPGLPGREVAA